MPNLRKRNASAKAKPGRAPKGGAKPRRAIPKSLKFKLLSITAAKRVFALPALKSEFSGVAPGTAAPAIACPLKQDQVTNLVVNIISAFHPNLQITPGSDFGNLNIQPQVRQNYQPEIAYHMSIVGCSLKPTFSPGAVAACSTVQKIAELAFASRL